jgi:hypothetical protein
VPDWSRLVREQLSLADLSPEQQKETVAELAGHFDDLHAEYRAQGLSQSEAANRAIHEVTDWRGLAKTIQRAKREEGTMNHRTTHLWLPGPVSTAIALVLPILSLMALNREPIVMAYLRSGSTPELLWLLASASGGATGAGLSRRAGGKSFARLASALFPVVVIVVAVWAFIVLAPSFGAYQLLTWRELVHVILPTVSACGAALLLGALPFLRPRRGGESGVSHA